MARIKVNATEFKAVAKKFNSAAERCSKIQEKLKTASDDLLGHWSGKSKEAFSTEYNTLYKNMYNYKDVLECIAKDLDTIAVRFEEADKSLKDGMEKTM